MQKVLFVLQFIKESKSSIPLQLIFQKTFLYIWGEWPSGLRDREKNRKVPGSNPTRHSAELRDPNFLRGSQWPSVQNLTYAIVNIE